jgi:MFS family permease
LNGTAESLTGQATQITGTHWGFLIVFLVYALGGVGQLVGGLLADKISAAWGYVATISITVPLAFLLSMANSSWGGWVAGVMAMFLFAQQPFENSIVADATPPHLRSTMYGLKFVLAFGVAALGGWVAGRIWSVVGVHAVFAMYGCGAILMAILAALYTMQRERPSLHN